jgi:transketolase
MQPSVNSRMRDAFIEVVISRMEQDDSLVFLSADFGSPKLDVLIRRFPDRFVNVGIAEQNLVNVAAGMALEGCSVIAYAIAPFISMRCFEQVRVNLCLLSQVRPMKVTLAGVGAGYSYDVSGPTHQALEDISIMRTLPNMSVYSPADSATARVIAEQLLTLDGIRYIRMDGKEVPDLAPIFTGTDLARGFRLIKPGKRCVLVATGYMTHQALMAAEVLKQRGVDAGVLDMVTLTPADDQALENALAGYKAVLSIEEGFCGKGGMDALLRGVLWSHAAGVKYKALGLPHTYRFEIGSRQSLLSDVGLGPDQIADQAQRLLG